MERTGTGSVTKAMMLIESTAGRADERQDIVDTREEGGPVARTCGGPGRRLTTPRRIECRASPRSTPPHYPADARYLSLALGASTP